MLRFNTGILFLIVPFITFSQEVNYTSRTFPETRIVNGHSVETNNEGVLKFLIEHRFGAVNAGIYDFFGFDDANMRIGFDYGIKDWWTIGIGRSSFNKTYDGYTKFKVIRQKSGAKSFPFTMTWLSRMAVETIRDDNPDYDIDLKHRITYANQLLIARKFGERFSLQLSPTLIHRNLVASKEENNQIYSLGISPKVLVSKNFSINVEYYYSMEEQLTEGLENSLAVGFNFETKGHVFQLSFGNSRGIIEHAFITQTTDTWEDGEIHFGFNITRDFKLKGRPYRKFSWE